MFVWLGPLYRGSSVAGAALLFLRGPRHKSKSIEVTFFLMVFAAHAGLQRYVSGDLGVTVFFFLSGFLITTLLRVEYETSGNVNLRHFWVRRLLRIWPSFYVVLLIATIAALLLDPAGVVWLRGVAALFLHYGNYWIYFDRLVGGQSSSLGRCRTHSTWCTTSRSCVSRHYYRTPENLPKYCWHSVCRSRLPWPSTYS